MNEGRTKPTLSYLRELLKICTPVGDWASGGDEVYAGRRETYVEICRMRGDAPWADNHAHLIALAVNALPLLLDLADKARGVARYSNGEWVNGRVVWVPDGLSGLQDALVELDKLVSTVYDDDGEERFT